MVVYTKRVQVPIDRGWAWVILAASFFGQFLMALIYLSGIFQVIFLEVFKADKFTTSWIFSVNGALLSFLGPVSSYLNRRFGSRVTVIIGSLVGSTGFILSAFSQTFWQLFLSYGVIVGSGFGIAYLPCAVSVGFYFEKYRNLAFGLINTSVGIASMALSPMINLTNQYYGWRGTMLILAGMYLQLCIVGAVLRPVDYSEELDVEHLEDDDMKQMVIDSSQGTSGGNDPERSALPETPLYNRHLRSLVHSSRTSHLGSIGVISNSSRRSGREKCSASLTYPAMALLGATADIQSIASSSMSLASQRNQGSGLYLGGDRMITSLNDVTKTQNGHFDRETCSDHNLTMGTPRHHGNGMPVREHLSVAVNGFGPEHSNNHVTSSRNQPDQSRKCRSQRRTYSESSHATCYEDTISAYPGNKGITGCKQGLGEIDNKEIRQNRSFFAVLRSRAFVLYCFMQLLVCIAISLAYQHFPYYVQSLGTTKEETSLLLVYMGIANCASRLLTGMAINSESMDPLLVQIGSNGVAGTLFLFSPLLVKTYAGQIIFCLCFGFFANCYNALFGPLTILFVGLEQLSNAFGVLLIMCGTGFLIGPPIAGALYDVSGSFEISFILAGVLFILGAILLMLTVVGKPVPETTFVSDEDIQLDENKRDLSSIG